MTTRRVLITGVTGFVGSHLADFLNTVTGIEVWGTRRRRSDLSNLHAPVTLIDCEITDPAHVFRAVSG
ncbi:MAG: NAD-dependent epimerase/dehydratase family protein, partial [Planctomycetes bacterium]|nr:NAD-dependent epimerase/dehydratase family protein [Planctomycetota bacterium]